MGMIYLIDVYNHNQETEMDMSCQWVILINQYLHSSFHTWEAILMWKHIQEQLDSEIVTN